MNLSSKVESELRRKFPEHLRVTAREILLSHEDLPASAPCERVALAILQLSSGEIGKLSHFSDRAREDWRDVLYWAEYTREDSEPKSLEELKKMLRLPDTKFRDQ